MNQAFLLLGCVGWMTAATAQDATHPELTLLDVQRVWDAAPHNAFTDLTRFNDAWFLVFREGQGHVSDDGALRVLTSRDGDTWRSAALIESDKGDLRDAKISVTPDGQLMLAGAIAFPQPADRRHQSLAWFSDDGIEWSRAYEIGEPDNWLWRVTWNENAAYGFGYETGDGPRGLRFFRSENGKAFETVLETVDIDGTYPNETSILFPDPQSAIVLVRQDGEPKTGTLGTSRAPFTEWEWRPLDRRIGGPHWIQTPDGRYLSAVRLYDGKTRTALCWIDTESGKVTEALTLPSGGDTSYAGLGLDGDTLFVSYYSSHEEKTAIYLARVRLDSENPTPINP